jgi:RHS repeat-associated protein
LTQDGRWSYVWDSENRLISMTMVAPGPDGFQRQLQFAYDDQGRRIQKTTGTWNGYQLTPQSTNRFVYDGWNLIAILGPQNAVQQSFLWGTDLSGTMQGAGGVGGLLAISDQSTINNQPSTHFVAYDGNGNVMALVNAADGSVSAQYEYGPFGEVIRTTGPMAQANPFRFSTKYQDDETDLLYYGYRYYSASAGRWLNRDPIEERGGHNLNAFAGNDAISHYDPVGLEIPWPGYPGPPTPPPPLSPPMEHQANKCSNSNVAAAIELANQTMKTGKCAKWFKDHGAQGENYAVYCHGKCKIPCLAGATTWTYPGTIWIGVCQYNLDYLGPPGIATLLIHEAAHHYCPLIGLGGESCAESAQEACSQ